MLQMSGSDAPTYSPEELRSMDAVSGAREYWIAWIASADDTARGLSCKSWASDML